MKNNTIETSRMFFSLPFDRMLQLIEDLDSLDEHIFMNSEMCSENWSSSLRRKESRCEMMLFRIEFELGLGAPLKDGTIASNLDVAKDLFERGWINQDRYEVAVRGEKSKAHDQALAKKEEFLKVLEADTKRLF